MADGPSPQRRALARALRQVRRETWKAAGVHAAFEATAVAMAVALVLGVVDPVALDRVAFGDPAAVAAAGLLAFVVGVAARVRRPAVERYEAVNPGVAEALRTARDAAADDAEAAMARALYADVTERLRATSSLPLLDVRRLAATLVLVLALSVGTVTVTGVGFDPFGGPPTDGAGGPGPGPGGGPDHTYSGLRDGEEVLGEPTDVVPGGDDLDAVIGGTSGGEGGDAGAGGGYAPGLGGGGSAPVEAQQAGYAATERLEDADLIREYALEIGTADEETNP